MFHAFCRRQTLCDASGNLHLPCALRFSALRLQRRTMASSTDAYAGWSHDELVQRVITLEEKLTYRDSGNKYFHGLKANSSAPSKHRQIKKPKAFDWSKHSTRFIALKFAYLGKRYNGFEHHANNATPLPTIEETLWQALMKAKLINPTEDDTSKQRLVNWDGCDYSKCGRTDRGVSAFGQVIGLRVRTNRPNLTIAAAREAEKDAVEPATSTIPDGDNAQMTFFDDLVDELPYIQILNSILPLDIRILAWCPCPPKDFSARFSCRARHYKYFFTQPAYMPTPGPPGFIRRPPGTLAGDPSIRDGWLDIDRMQEAAKRFEGLHDFRNFCKVDPSKQISDHRRRIFRSEIRPLSRGEEAAAYVSNPLFAKTASSVSQTNATLNQDSLAPQVYVFDLQGSAFLWHQVRHMIAILFLVGQGLEAPSIIDRLLDAENHPEKPVYEMAEETPLVLWNCVFPTAAAEDKSEVDIDPLHDSLQWIYAGEIAGEQNGKSTRGPHSTKYGLGGAVDTIWGLWRESKMDEILRGSLLNLIAHQPDVLTAGFDFDRGAQSRKPHSQKIFDGSRAPRYSGTYIPLLKRERLKSVEVQNREYAEKRGIPFKSSTTQPQDKHGDHMEVE